MKNVEPGLLDDISDDDHNAVEKNDTSKMTIIGNVNDGMTSNYMKRKLKATHNVYNDDSNTSWDDNDEPNYQPRKKLSEMAKISN